MDEIEDEAERLVESARANRQASDDNHDDKEQEDDQIVDRDETDPTMKSFFDGEDLTQLQSIGLVKRDDVVYWYLIQ